MNYDECNFETVVKNLLKCMSELEESGLDNLSISEAVHAIKLLKTCKAISEGSKDLIKEIIAKEDNEGEL